MTVGPGSQRLRYAAMFVGLAFCLRGAWALDVHSASGRRLAQDVYKGNCLACHQVPGDASAESLANIGPPLFHMRERFPDRAALRSQLSDPMARNPQTVMPPFGKHKVLTEEEIERIIDYIYEY
jgi:L-cysteine S-thiosulfotransferase